MSTAPTHAAAGALKSPILVIGGGLLLVAAILAVLISFDLHEQSLRLLEWIEAQGPAGAGLFILLMAAFVVLLLPGVFLTVGGGFVFGVLEGTLLVVIGTVLGSVAAFLIARHLFSERASRFILRHGNLRLVGDELARNDFKVVMLVRLIPFFPGKLTNYVFGLTRFSLRGFTLGSLVGFIPFSLHNVYLGSLAADLSGTSEGIGRSPLQWAFYGLGAIATLVALIYFNSLARKALARHTAEQPADADPQDPGPGERAS